MVPAGNSELRTEARSARRLDKTPTAFEAAQLIKPPALRGVSDCQAYSGCSAPIPGTLAGTEAAVERPRRVVAESDRTGQATGTYAAQFVDGRRATFPGCGSRRCVAADGRVEVHCEKIPVFTPSSNKKWFI